MYPKLKQAIDDEMDALISHQTWGLLRTFYVCSKLLLVVSIKHHLDDTVNRYKARLVVRDFTHTYSVDYLETFSLVARLNFILVM